MKKFKLSRVAFFLRPVDPDVELSVTSQHYACLPATMMRTDKTSETANQP